VRLSDIWSAAGFLIALELGAFSWRLSREINMSERGEPTWLPVAEFLNLAAMVVAVVGVFILPIAGFRSSRLPRVLLGVSLVLFVGHAFALAGHYELFTPGPRSRPAPYATLQEWIAVGASILLAMLFVAVALALT
jgi:hypothetical protein